MLSLYYNCDIYIYKKKRLQKICEPWIMILIFNDSCTFKVFFFFPLTFSVMNLKFKWDKKEKKKEKGKGKPCS